MPRFIRAGEPGFMPLGGWLKHAALMSLGEIPVEEEGFPGWRTIPPIIRVRAPALRWFKVKIQFGGPADMIARLH